MGLDELILGSIFRYIRPYVRNEHLDRLENILNLHHDPLRYIRL